MAHPLAQRLGGADPQLGRHVGNPEGAPRPKDLDPGDGGSPVMTADGLELGVPLDGSPPAERTNWGRAIPAAVGRRRVSAHFLVGNIEVAEEPVFVPHNTTLYVYIGPE